MKNQQECLTEKACVEWHKDKGPYIAKLPVYVREKIESEAIHVYVCCFLIHQIQMQLFCYGGTTYET